jgi:hypothetical protein
MGSRDIVAGQMEGKKFDGTKVPEAPTEEEATGKETVLHSNDQCEDITDAIIIMMPQSGVPKCRFETVRCEIVQLDMKPY